MRTAAAGAVVTALVLTAAVLFAPATTSTVAPSPTATPVVAAPVTGDTIAAASAAATPVEPTRVRIPAIDADSERGGSMQRLGLQPDRTIEVPPIDEPLRAGWYRHAPMPGEVGTSVVLGHIDGQGRPGVFERLRDVRPGDVVIIDREDGTRLRFVIYAVENVDKSAFPSARIYGQANRPELRVISCGGVFVGGDLGYADNVIVYATLDT